MAVPDMAKDDPEYQLLLMSVTVLCSSTRQSRVVRGKKSEDRDHSPLLATPKATSGAPHAIQLALYQMDAVKALIIWIPSWGDQGRSTHCMG